MSDYINYEIPQDFLDIDPITTNWVMTGVSGSNEGRRFPDKNLFCVPSTDAPSDMTDAMMSEIPGWDDTVMPKEVADRRWYKFCMAYLMQDGNLGVPGGRYGSTTQQCAQIAIVMALIMQYHQGEPITYYSLNSDMSMVVNSSDGVATMISESQYLMEDIGYYGQSVKELLGDEYIPQTPLEQIAAHCGVEIDICGEQQTLSITMDEEDAEKLLNAITANEAPFNKDD